MSGEDDYESLREGASIGTVMTAGAIAGIMEHCVMFPVDCVKTRMQALACDKTKFRSSSIFANLINIAKTEGLFRPLKGVQPLMLGAGPAHAVYFACYEHIKTVMTPVAQQSVLPETVVHGVAGAAATVFHDAVMTPADVVKQRLQQCCSPYKSAWNCANTVYRTEGIGAFYRSYTTILTMNIPFQAVHFMVYEQMMNLINSSGEYVPWKHAVSGGMAGAVAATITMPWDVMKTLLNTQEANVLTRLNTKRVSGILDAFRTVRGVAGWAGFYKGWRARVIYQAPSTAISWCVYESFKYYLKEDSAKTGSREETIDDLRQGQAASRAGGEAEAERRDSRLWDQIVTDLPQVQVVRAEAAVNTSDLVVRDSFPGYRT